MKTIKPIVFILCMAMFATVLSACDMFNEPLKDESSAVLSNDEISKVQPDDSTVDTSARMTLQEVKDIVRQNDTFAEIMAALEQRQPVADNYYGSGVTLIDYYMDDEGRQKVMIIYEQGQIYYKELLFGNAE